MATESASLPAESVPDEPIQVRRARQGLIVFACFLIPLSLFGYWFNVNFRDAPLFLPSLPLALSPGLASVITRLLRGEGFADVSFRRRGPRMKQALLLALGLPLVVGTAAYGVAYLLGLIEFNPPPFPAAVSPPLAQFAVNLAFVLTVGILLLLPSTGGEEIGWRGYLLPRLIEARLPQPILLSALIWGAWHLPVVFAGVYLPGTSLLPAVVLLMLATLAFGTLLAWMRLATGSIWPCILAHAAWNSVINGAFTPATTETGARLWTGETGVLVVLALVLATLLLRRSWQPDRIDG